MTTAPAGQWSGSEGFLFQTTNVASALEASGVADVVRGQLKGFTQATRNQAVKEVERITAELASVNPVHIIVDALCTYHELREAGNRTVNEPDSTELVELIEHQVTFQNQPLIKVVVNGKQIATLQMLLSLVFDIQTLTATVRAGRLTALQIGRCDATGSVGIEGRTIAHRQAHVMLPASIPLRAGVPLVAQHASPAEPGPGGPRSAG